jgi:K+-transporting ATPase ATPase C chain
MVIKYLKKIRIAFMMIILFTALTGVIYPVIITGISQLFFPWQANGSLIIENGTTIGSQFIGQNFSDPKYFWGRPSATTPYAYNAANSAGSNMGPSNPHYLATLNERIKLLRQTNPKAQIPVDLVTASGSGLDPEISPLSAYYQVYRIAAVRKIPEREIQTLIKNMKSSYTFGILGEPRVNVLQLNLALDALTNHKR